jgi:hypothetical protein
VLSISPGLITSRKSIMLVDLLQDISVPFINITKARCGVQVLVVASSCQIVIALSIPMHHTSEMYVDSHAQDFVYHGPSTRSIPACIGSAANSAPWA